MILLRLFCALLLVIVTSRLAVVAYMVSGSIGCGVQPTMFELSFVIVKPSLFVGMSAAGSHDVMDCVPIGTVVNDTVGGLGWVRTRRSQ